MGRGPKGVTALHRAAGEGHEEAGSETERPTGKCKAGSKGGERLSLQHYFIPSFSTSLLQHGLRYMLKSLSSNIAHLRSAQPGELGKASRAMGSGGRAPAAALPGAGPGRALGGAGRFGADVLLGRNLERGLDRKTGAWFR